VVAPHQAEGPIATAVCVQIGACTPNLLVQELFDEFNVDWEREIVTPPVEVIRLGDEPGADQSEEAPELLADGRPFVLFVSSVSAHKNHQMLLHVWRRLAERHGDALPTLALVGGTSYRGADLLDTTPRQLWLYDRLGLTAPARFSHVPLMLGDDGERLAKRHGAITLEERIETGQNVEEIRQGLLASVPPI